ncbi:MAG: GNAT family N-acetyltransferase [Campylobacteraceae bacterium]
MSIKVRIATRDDAKNITEFNVIFAKKYVDKNLSLPITEAGVHNVFAGFNNGFYLVAEKERKIVGMTMITREWSDWSNGAFYCVQSVYISDEEYKKTILDAILNKAKSLAKEHAEVCGIRVYVEKSNEELQNHYKELGLKETNYKLFEEEFRS